MNKGISVSRSLIFALVAGMYFSAVPTVEAQDAEAPAESGAGVTVYLDIGRFGRQERAAERITEIHETYFQKGWTVIDVDPYVEDGDLQGFFITYVRR